MPLFSFTFSAMASACEFHLYAPTFIAAEQVAKAAQQEILRIEKTYSRFDPQSDLSRLNRDASRPQGVEVNEEMAGLLDFAFSAYQKSDHLFDITTGCLGKLWNFATQTLPNQAEIDQILPLIGMDKLVWQAPYLYFTTPGMSIDLGGLGKEYACDRAYSICRNLGGESGLINLAGDIRIIGPHPDGQAWMIDIQAPDQPDQSLCQIALSQGALATSGTYVRAITQNGCRYSHILNPQTGWPIRGLSSATALAEDCLIAGSITSIALLKGLGGRSWLNHIGLDHFWISDAGEIGGTLLKT